MGIYVSTKSQRTFELIYNELNCFFQFAPQIVHLSFITHKTASAITSQRKIDDSPFPTQNHIQHKIIFLSFLFLSLRLHVRLHEELSEEDQQREDVTSIEGSYSEVEGFTLTHNQVSSLAHHGHKLDHLHHSQR